MKYIYVRPKGHFLSPHSPGDYTHEDGTVERVLWWKCARCERFYMGPVDGPAPRTNEPCRPSDVPNEWNARVRPWLVLLAPFLLTCARYAPHDPHSYCQERQLEPRLRPVLKCSGAQDDPAECGKGGVVLEFHWTCKRWSSW